MELTIIILYLLAIFGVGIYCNKFNKGLDDYLVAGRRLGVGLATGTLVATYFGGGYVIGVGGEAFSTGLSAYWSPIAGGLGILAVCLILKKMEGMKLYTVTEIVERRYNSSVLRLLTTILSLLALIGILASQVTSAGSVIASLGFGSLTTCSIIVAAFFIGFTAFGGMWAVTVTDFVQIVVAAVGLIAATIFTIVKSGGWAAVVEKIAATNPPDNYYNILKGTEPSYVLWLGIHVGFLGHLYFDGIPIAVIQSHCPGQYGKKEGSERCRACLCCRIPLGRNRRHIPYLLFCVPQLTQIRHARPDRLGCDFWENNEAVRVVRLQIGNACCAVRLPNDRNDRVVVPKDDLSKFGGAGLRRASHAEQH